jgi:aspartyl-tRNA(Asn)/glutamyl-tRNA(Gln) amidotransferase subunit B
MTNKYELVIGLEIHLQLNTKSKAFCSDAVEFGATPNSHVSAISLGHPGTLPKLNKQQVENAVKLGLALGCTINRNSFFDRKNYFYADLPKGYQITQDRQPICVGGGVDLNIDGTIRPIRLHHIHMEEDAGKSIHDLDEQSSFIDLNRAGTPLLEIVTEPDLRSPEEVAALMNAIRQMARYLEISDGNMEEGSMRCDCNISVRLRGASEYGERCEVKNVNSMRFAKQAIEYEFKRQVEIIEKGGKIERQTLNFDPATGITTPLRSKEDANDYRYFPEPDLPPVVLSEERLSEIQNSLPPLPKKLFEEFTTTLGVSSQDAYILTEEKDIALYFKELCDKIENKKALSNLVINKVKPYLGEKNISIAEFPLSAEQINEFISIIDNGKVGSALAYQRIFPVLLEQPTKTALAIAESLDLIQNTDVDFIEQVCRDVVAAFPDKVKEYNKGKKGLIGFFMGEVMKRSKGQAEPKSATALLTKILAEA